MSVFRAKLDDINVKNIFKNVKPFKFCYAKSIELLILFYTKIFRKQKTLKFIKSKKIGSLNLILLVLIRHAKRLFLSGNLILAKKNARTIILETSINLGVLESKLRCFMHEYIEIGNNLNLICSE